MKKLPLLVAVVSAAGVFLLPAPTTVAEDRPLLDFTPKEREKLEWNVVNDGVMGGLSKGKVSFSESGTLKFEGKLSLENNGGFSTVRTGRVDLSLGKYDGLKMRVKGDGRTYEVRIGTDARYRFMEVSFMAEFPTRKGEWSEVSVPFDSFTGSFRGRSLPDEEFDPNKIQQVGFLLADKKAGDFELEVDWVRAYSASDDKKSDKKGAAEKPASIVDIAVSDGRFKTLAAALTKAELVEVLQGEGPFTVFAPTDEAFAKLPRGTVDELLKPENNQKLQAILKYHVVAGSNSLSDALGAKSIGTVQGQSLSVQFADGRVKVNGSVLLAADISGSNGVIHVIDSVLLPEDEKKNSILSVAKKAGKFGTLIAAVEAAGLTSLLEGDGPFTVFAPSDEAFANLPKGTVESLLKPENLEKLKGILTYHVISGRITAGDALNAKSATTANGQEVKVTFEDGSVKVNGADLLAADIEAPNGIIHVIDSVLLPGKSEKKGTAGDGGRADAVELIEAAIDKGVPLYNSGDPGACAEVYRACVQSLVESDAVGGDLRKMLTAVLEKGASVESEDAKAWIYRKALDGSYHLLERNRN